MTDTGRIFIEPIIIITEPKLAKVIASVAIILRASLELATIRAGDFGSGGDTRSSGRVLYRTAGCGVEGGRAGSYPQHQDSMISIFFLKNIIQVQILLLKILRDRNLCINLI